MMRAFSCLTSCSSSQHLAKTGQVPAGDKERSYRFGGEEVGKDRTAICILGNSLGLRRRAFSSLHEPVFQPVTLQVRVSLNFYSPVSLRRWSC